MELISQSVSPPPNSGSDAVLRFSEAADETSAFHQRREQQPSDLHCFSTALRPLEHFHPDAKLNFVIQVRQETLNKVESKMN